MTKLKFIEKEKATSWNFMKELKNINSNKGKFWQNLKYSVMSNNFIKYGVLVGLGATIIDTVLFSNMLFIIEWLGAIAGGYALSNAIKSNEHVAYKDSKAINTYLIKSVVLIVLACIAAEGIMYLPYAHFFKYFTTIILFAGISGLFESGIEKYRRNNSN